MQLLQNYKNINDTLRWMRLQVIDSYDYACNNCPEFDRPAQLFTFLKKNTIYKKDPAGKELLQSMQTLFENNFHGISGAGDCDCLVVTTLACMKAQGWDNLYIILAGRNKSVPVHIWTGIDYNDNYYDFDLTCPYFNLTRNYKYVQTLKI